MKISFTSILESVLFSNFMILILYVTIKYKGKNLYANPRFILPCALLIMFRCFLPCEFFFTITLESRRILPNITNIFASETVFGIIVYHLFILIWIIIAAIKLAILIIRQIKSEKTIAFYPNSTYTSILQEIINKNNITRSIDLVEIPNLSTPAIIGLRKTRIIVPQGIPKKDLYYILLHEIEHYKNHDLYFIAALQLLCIIYWWNPIIYILRDTS